MLIYLLLCIFNVELVNGREKIFGGRYAREGEFPFVVAILGKHRCAAGLITLKKIVSAAHCLAEYGRATPLDPDEIYVVGGVVDLESINYGFNVKSIWHIMLHPSYKPKSRFHGNIPKHDMGLALLDRAFILHTYIQPMVIPSWDPDEFISKWDTLVRENRTCWSMGWGTTEYEKRKGKLVPIKSSKFLKVIEVYSVDSVECRKSFKRNEDMTRDGEVCVYPLIRGETVCTGDSGSPLVCDGLAYGILSWGPTCGDPINNVQGFLLFWRYLGLAKMIGSHLVITKWLILLISLLPLSHFI